MRPAALHATPDWAQLPELERRGPVLTIDKPVRMYVCTCRRWDAEQTEAIAYDHDLKTAPNVPWECAGHPSPELPLVLGELSLASGVDCAHVVRRILEGVRPRALELPHGAPEGPGLWLCWLYAYLSGLPVADDLSAAIAERVEDRDPHVVGRVLHFFARFPAAKGLERVVAFAEAGPHRVAVGYPIPEFYVAPTLWSVLAARLAEQPDARVDALIRRVLLIPLASLSHEDLGPTDLVECERQLRLRHGWDPNGEHLRTHLQDYARLKKSERIDVVASQLEYSHGAFDDVALRRFLADHIVEIDAAAKGRWRLVMHLLTDWRHKPDLAHLIVVAGTRVFRAGLASAAELRAWIQARRAYGWVRDEWVLPLERLLEEG